MIPTLIAIAASIPTGLVVNWITPWLKTQAAMRNRMRREKRIERLRRDFKELQDSRAGKLTNKLIVVWATAIAWLITIGLMMTLDVLAQALVIVKSDNSHGAPRAETSFTVSKGVASAELEVLMIVFFLLAVFFIYYFQNLLKWARRLCFDEEFDDFRRITEQNLNKLGASFEVTDQEAAATKIETTSGLSS